MDYRYANDYLDFSALYMLSRDANLIQTSQKLRYTLNGVTTTTFTGTVLSSTLPLPDKTITGSFRDDSEGIAGKLSIAKSSLLLQSGDYNDYKWHLTTLHDTLKFLPMLPEALQNSHFTGSAQGDYHLDTNTLNGSFNAKHNHADINGTLYVDEDHLRIKGNAILPEDAPTWKDRRLKPPSDLDFSITHTAAATDVSINGDDIALCLKQEGETIEGSGNYLASFFDFNGTQSDTESVLTITSLTPSLNKTLSLLPFITLPDTGYYDAEIRTSTRIAYDTQFHVKTDITIPWYAAVVDSKHQYSGTNSTLSLQYDADQIIIDHYHLDIADHPITSPRKSYLHTDPSGNLIIDEIWIYDALRLEGAINRSTLAAVLNLKSDKFTYTGPEGEAHVALDLHYDRDENASQTLTGKRHLTGWKNHLSAAAAIQSYGR